MKENVLTLQRTYDQLSAKLSDPDVLKNQDEYQKLTRDHKRVGKQLKVGRKWLSIVEQIDENRALLKTEKDPELVAMIREELAGLEERLEPATEALEEALL
ncbi:PCRF domain-containing protein, partial [bacterium]|nr:PCRF domain-containing protein [bacterium]